MKELSIEEKVKRSIEGKAKRYDEALERARKELQICGSSDCDAARQIFRFFPELKEPEDERIRKTLIDFFSKGAKYRAQTNGIYDKDIIAWLEKQGEHAKFKDSIQVGDKVTRNEDGVLVNLSQLNRVAKKDEKQGEHKSAWSQEDCSKVQRICKYLNEAKKYYADITEVRECIDWLKSLNDRV
jgi:hypothetical protein